MDQHVQSLVVGDVSRPTLVIVLGMHRSGTSVATRLMETMGASLGDNLWPAGPDNPKGFFEDSDVIALNIELMEAAGVDWQALPPPDFSKLDDERLHQFQQRALALLREKCAGGLFALKDPRIARLLPFWQPVFEQLHARVLYVVTFRHPLSVAHSLANRNQIPHSKSYVLWLAHTVPALCCTQNHPRALLNYDRLMESPREELHKLSQTLGLALDPERAQAFEQDFLEKDLCHSTFGIDDLDRDDAAPQTMKALFRSMVAVAGDATPAHLTDYANALAGAEAFLHDVVPTLSYAWERELDIRKLYEVLDTMQKRAVVLEQALTDAAAREADVRSALEHAAAREAVMRSALDESNGRLTANAEKYARQVELLLAANDESRATIRELDARLASRAEQLARSEATVASMSSSTSWRITAPLRLTRRYIGR